MKKNTKKNAFYYFFTPSEGAQFKNRFSYSERSKTQFARKYTFMIINSTLTTLNLSDI
jgi:hypothetical protein